MGLTLMYISLAVVFIVVVVLVLYLLGIIVALRNANRNLGQLAGGLQQIAADTQPLTEKLTTINGALHQLHTGLVSVDGHLAGAARLLGR
jgi:uncharacterized protein YoxC